MLGMLLLVVTPGYSKKLRTCGVDIVVMDYYGTSGFILHIIDNLPPMSDNHANAGSRNPHFEGRRELLIIKHMGSSASMQDGVDLFVD